MSWLHLGKDLVVTEIFAARICLFMDEYGFGYQALKSRVRTQAWMGLMCATYNNISLMNKLQADLKDGDVQKIDEITEVINSHPVIDILG